MEQDRDANFRDFLISETFRFIALIISLRGILRIALMGALCQDFDLCWLLDPSARFFGIGDVIFVMQ